MPRSRATEKPQRQSTRAPLQLRTSSSDSNPLHPRPITDRSPKLGDRRSPRRVQTDSLNQKKLGTCIADLESQLGMAQEELKILKDQLMSAEAAKKEAQEELEKKSLKPIDPNEELKETNCDENQTETDVFEIQIEKAMVESNAETKPEEASLEDLALKNEEISLLEAKLEEKEKALEALGLENDDLKKQLEEANSAVSCFKNKEEETGLKINQLGEEVEASNAKTGQLQEKLTAIEGEKEALEAEMKKLRVQTEQWRKAADAAAAVLAGGAEINERCGSMDKHFGGYNGFMESPNDSDDGFGSGKRKGSGIKIFGDLWKKKNQK